MNPSTDRREANGTEKQEKPFGDTRQFDVPKGSSGDTLRERINQANEQSLRRKREAVSAASPNTKSARRTIEQTESERNTTQKNRQYTTKQITAQRDPSVSASTKQRTQTNGAASAQQRAHTTSDHSNPQQNGAYYGYNPSVHPVVSNTISPAAQQTVGGHIPAALNNTAQEAVRETPPQTIPQENGMRSNTQKQHVPSPAQSAQPAFTQPSIQNQTNHHGAQNHRPAEAAERLPVQHRERAAEKNSLQKTRVTDISTLSGHTKAGTGVQTAGGVKQSSGDKMPVKKPVPREKERIVSDEGGNTVISVVKAVIYMIFVVVVSVFLAVAIIMVGNDVFAFVKTDTAIPVTIPEYASLNDVIDILYQNNVIEYPRVFRLYAQLKKDNGKFVAGDYTVSPVMNYDELLDEFKEKPKLGTVRITFPEGYTTDEIIDLMVSYGIGTREGYEDVIQNYDFDYWFIDELEENGVSEDRFYRLDGYLFPDTYDFYNASSEATVINKMLRRFDQLFTDEHRRLCKEMGYSVDEILTIASLIEKEAGSAAEFFNVSSVFHNRLKAKTYFPRLESDATIVYAIQHETGERPQLKDTNYDSPYNTYLHDGLPPGPIANPSASAILAALSPAKTNYYYFVSDGGKTYFSETKEQHNQYIEAIKNNTIGQTYIPETDDVQ